MPDPPLRRDAERNRRLLLSTAHDLMARDGLAVTYEQIAHEAGLGMGTVYRRFPNRDDLVDALFAEHIDAVVALGREAVEHEDALAGLTWFMRRQLELEFDNRGLGELLRGGGQSTALVERGRARITPLATTLIDRAVAAGQLPPSTTTLDLVLVHLMVGAVMDISRGLDPHLWRRALAIAMSGLRTADLPAIAEDNSLLGQLYGEPPTRRKT